MAEGLLADRLTIGEALTDATGRLAAAGCDSPRLDAELLLAEVLGVARAWLVTERDTPLGPEPRRGFERLLGRRSDREPVAYILGRRDFRHLTLEVDVRVLIPRPETELLVEVGLGLPAGVSVLDVGAGSGAVALALADERPDLRVSGVDVDPDAVAVARANARRLGLAVEFSVCDLLPAAPAFDAVLANLPYVADAAALPPEIALWEPSGALFAGADGLAIVRRLIDSVGERRARGAGPSLLALEIGSEQSSTVAELVAGAGFAHVERRRDLAGHERVVVGRE